jgi:DNA-binding NarL/FixJ family response regulator
MKTILIIEDQPDMRGNLAIILKMEGYNVLTASNGSEGLASARQHLPDLVVCDVMMPELDGHGVLAALRADATTAHLPFIFLTARGEKRDYRTGMNLGADDYLTKPVNASDLISAVEARLTREQFRPPAEFKPDFTSSAPLEQALGLTPREAEVLLWVAQGKGNAEISVILGTTEHTVKKHLQNIFEKLGMDNRNACTVRALEVLAGARKMC